MWLGHCMRSIKNWGQDSMSIAIRKDFKCSWKRAASRFSGNYRSILIIMEKR